MKQQALALAFLALTACGSEPAEVAAVVPEAPVEAAAETAAPAEPRTHQRGQGEAYELLGSQVWDVPDPASGLTYQVFVQLPQNYETDPARRYPVLYVTDADYAFPVIRQISRRMNVERPMVADFILVGLSYSVGSVGAESRRRDYTPTENGPSTAPADAVHGQGARYQAYLRDQVKPFIEQNYRTAPEQAFLLGHSYGGLLGAQILLTEPEMFSGYVLGSPSFWYDKRHVFSIEEAYAASHDDLKAKVYMYVGEYEAFRPGVGRYNDSVDLVGDMLAFEDKLNARGYPSLTISSEVLNDEDHFSVAPRGFTHGLLELLPAE